MFTGLIQALGTVRTITPQGSGRRLALDLHNLDILPGIGDSVAISGVCLTVTEITGTVASFDAIAETLRCTSLGTLRSGDRVNLEPALRVGQPLDGHIVQGHVDAVGKLLVRDETGGSWLYRFSLPQEIAALVATKGSIAIDGISLTVVEAGADFFTAAIIPHTLACTTLGDRQGGDSVNLEADVLARYAARRAEVSADKGGGVSMNTLRENGFA